MVVRLSYVTLIPLVCSTTRAFLISPSRYSSSPGLQQRSTCQHTRLSWRSLQRISGPPCSRSITVSTRMSSPDKQADPAMSSLDSLIKAEEEKIRDAKLTAGQLKTELDSLGARYIGLLEKPEFVRALAEARVSSRGSSGEKKQSVRKDEPKAKEDISTGKADGENATSQSESGLDEAAERAKVSEMRLSDIREELTERGVDYSGLLDSYEYRNALVDARARGVTASASGSTTSASGPEASEGRRKGGSDYDPSYRELETKKIKRGKQEEQPDGGSPFGGGGNPFGGSGGPNGNPFAGGGSMGGMDIGSILGGMGGMGGMGGPGGPGGAGGGMGGMGDIGEMLGKVMNNPKAMAAFQKAQQNPKVMQAIQDVSRNGMSAIAKYRNDPEILAVIEELKELF